MASPSAVTANARRKRKSRFSDAATSSTIDPTTPPLKKPATINNTAVSSAKSGVVDAAALAKAAAAKIAQIIPDGAASISSTVNSSEMGGPSLVTASSSLPIAAAISSALTNEELEREKQLRKEQIWKSVQEQMGHIKALLRKPDNNSQSVAAATATAAAAAAAATAAASGVRTSSFIPAPLLLDDQGRQIDEHGNVIADSTPSTVVTLKANKATVKKQNPYLSHRSIEKDDKLEVVDPRIKIKKRETRATKSFSFVKQGTYVKQAENLRARDAKKMLAGFTSGRNPRAYVKQSIVPIDEEKDDEGTAAIANDRPQLASAITSMELHDVDVPLKPDSTVPEVEWWDVDFLPKHLRVCMDKFGFIKAKSRKENPDIAVHYDDMKLKFCGTINVIEHPARVNLIVPQKEQPVALPLMLTAAERKKIRRQQRAEREKEKQDKIALGLLPAPEPKVKLSNMMRVLAEQAVSDPSAIEKKVREQVAQRQQNHEMRNLARKLTPEERREKKLRKIKQDAAGDIHVALFRVDDLSNAQHRFKVDVNAQQYHLTGGVLMCAEDKLNLVVVEGGRKAIKHYSRLMLRRIKWNEDDDDDDDDKDEQQVNDQQAEDDDQSPTKTKGCELVWQGIVPSKAFKNFRFQECRSTVTARKVLEAKNVAHYWDLVEKSRRFGGS